MRAADPGELLGLAKKVHDLGDFLLDTFVAATSSNVVAGRSVE